MQGWGPCLSTKSKNPGISHVLAGTVPTTAWGLPRLAHWWPTEQEGEAGTCRSKSKAEPLGNRAGAAIDSGSRTPQVHSLPRSAGPTYLQLPCCLLPRSSFRRARPAGPKGRRKTSLSSPPSLGVLMAEHRLTTRAFEGLWGAGGGNVQIARRSAPGEARASWC